MAAHYRRYGRYRRYCRSALAGGLALLTVLSGVGQEAQARQPELPMVFDIQAHRGGRGERPESTRSAFLHALTTKVSTLEFDIHLSRDNVPVVWHDRILSEKKCRDTQPATDNDPLYPYVGKSVRTLTWRQLQTVRCDKTLAAFPQQKPASQAQLLTLSQLFHLVQGKRGAADRVYYNIEIKSLPMMDDVKTINRYVSTILETARRHGALHRVTIQSFDWRSLQQVRANPLGAHVPLSMLWNSLTWQLFSPMLGPINYAAVKGEIFRAAQILDAQIVSPNYGSATALVADREFCENAHHQGLRVVPYTVNDPQAMRAQIRAGADGLITDYPTLAHEILATTAVPL